MFIGHTRLRHLFKHLADVDSLASGYIFFGLPGVGKRTLAESLAHHLEGRAFEPSTHILQDALVAGKEGEGIGIETIRSIRAYLFQEPIVSLRRLVIIDNAENLSLPAENALLKIAEEPPLRGLIILVVSNPDVLLPTLVSRFQKIYFPPVTKLELENLPEIKRGSFGRAEELVRLSCGSPGKLLKMINVVDIVQKLPRQLISASAETRKKMIKDYLDEDRDPLALVDALILDFFLSKDVAMSTLQRALQVKRELASLNLNPRLQLESIFF